MHLARDVNIPISLPQCGRRKKVALFRSAEDIRLDETLVWNLRIDMLVEFE
jgi:hypothetical protein